MKVLFSVMVMVFSLVVHAQHKFIEMTPPKAKPYLKKQLERMDAIKAFKLKGHIGESDNAMLAIRESKGLKPQQIEKMNKLVAEENKDRKAIFEEIAKFNKLNKSEKEILIKSAYETYRNTDAKGIYYKEKNTWQKRY
jgi:uncharacterized protein